MLDGNLAGNTASLRHTVLGCGPVFAAKADFLRFSENSG
jgi:hypothetical protein